MGAPNTLYSLLWEVMNSDNRFHAQSCAELERFSLCAIVLDSPDKNGSLHKTLEKDFEYLDSNTTNDFLFFAPVDEPKSWRKLAQDRWPSLERRMSHPLRVRDRARMSFNMAAIFGVELADLPALYVTTDLRAKTGWLVPTNTTHLRNQLHDLGYHAQQIAREGHPFQPPGEWIPHTLDFDPDCASALYLAFASSEPPSYFRDQNQHWLDNASQARLKALAAEESDQRRIFLAWQSAVFATSDFRKTDPRNVTRFGGELGFDQDSQRWLHLATKLEETLMNTGGADLSPCGYLVSKAFERELQLSLAQAVRRWKGISYPEHFDKLAQDFGALLVGKADFNQSKNSRLKYPTFMPMLTGYVGAWKDHAQHECDQNDRQRTTNLRIIGEAFCAHRNNLSHPNEPTNYDEMTELFAQMKHDGHWKFLTNMKNKLRSSG